MAACEMDARAHLLAEAERAIDGTLDLRELPSDSAELAAAEALVDQGIFRVLSARRYQLIDRGPKPPKAHLSHSRAALPRLWLSMIAAGIALLLVGWAFLQ